MRSFTSTSYRIGWAFLVGALACQAAAAQATGSTLSTFRFKTEGSSINQPSQTMNVATRLTAPQTGFYSAPQPTTYGPSGYAPYVDPTGGFLNGAASVISAQGDLEIKLQQAKIYNEAYKQAHIETRRRNFDEWLYELAHTPTTEDWRERRRVEKLKRVLNDPPVTEIHSGYSLNFMLGTLQRLVNQTVNVPTVTVEQSILSRINFSTGSTTKSLGVFKVNEKIKWPLPFYSSQLKAARTKFDTQAAAAMKQAAAGMVEPETLQSLLEGQKQMAKLLKKNIDKFNPNQYIQAKRFLNDLDGSLDMLQQADLSTQLDRKWVAEVRSVGDLVKKMAGKGMKFAPATAGEQSAYQSLYTSMVTFFDRLNTYMSSSSKMSRG